MRLSIRTFEEDLVVWFSSPVYALSYTIDGGFRRIRYVVFSHVDTVQDIELKVSKYRSILGKEHVMIFLTAVKPAFTCSIVFLDEVLVVETAGFENTFSIVKGKVKSRLNSSNGCTINILVFVDSTLSLPDLAELIQTVTYAKVASLLDYGVTCRGGFALGTTSDATLVACRELSQRRAFTGPITRVGSKVIYAVYRATTSLLRRYFS